MDKTRKCRFCGAEIFWEKIDGGWVPFNAGDISVLGDHRESCPGMNRSSRERIKGYNHELAVKRFFASVPKQKKRSTRIKRKYAPKVATTGSDNEISDDGSIPW